MHFRTWLASAVILGVVLPFTPAQADPVRVTSGGLTVSSTENPFFLLGSDSFSLGAMITGRHTSMDLFMSTCRPSCVPGTIFGGSAAASDPEQLGDGPGTVNGVEYERLFYTGSLTFSAPDGVVPPAGVPGTGPPQTILPFTFSGHIRAFLSADLAGVPLVDTALVGSGTVTFSFVRPFPERPDGSLDFAQVDYDFESANVVPEPATLLLFGTGAALAAHHRRRSSRIRS